jgi:peptidoglycan-associated lipoprotein
MLTIDRLSSLVSTRGPTCAARPIGGTFLPMSVGVARARWVSTLIVACLGCAHTPAPKAEVAAAQPTPPAPEPPKEEAASDGSCSSDRACGEKELCIRRRCVPISTGLAECSTIRVHFDFDMVDLKDTDKPGLNRIARCLRADHALQVTIEGNSDDRGTEEYNMALGQRRAGVVDSYLEALGVSHEQLKTVSYGYEKPVCKQHNERCWAKNRQASLKPHEDAGGK